jgi:hypothetical protein
MLAKSRTNRFIRGLGRSSSNKAFRRRLPRTGEGAVGRSLSGPIVSGSIVAVGACEGALQHACDRFSGLLIGESRANLAFRSRHLATGLLRTALLL